MTARQQNLEASRKIAGYLSDQAFNNIALTPSQDQYQPWYAMLLSAISLLAVDDEVIYATSNLGEPVTDVRILAFTNRLLIIAIVDPELDGVPQVQAISRSSLSRMSLSASGRIDAKEGQAGHSWPGQLSLHLTFRDLPDPVELVADGADYRHVHEPSPIVKLIEALRDDLVA